MRNWYLGYSIDYAEVLRRPWSRLPEEFEKMKEKYYSLGWGVGGGWVVGAGGHAYRQIADDKQAGATVAGGNRGRSFSIGPSVKYDSGKGWFVTVKWQKESAVRNKAEGSAFWLKAVFPL